MKKAFSAPVVIILITLIGIVCLAVLYFINLSKNNTSPNVKGVSSNEASHEKPGVSIFVSSNNGSWELNVYLCVSSEECSMSLTSGRRWSTTGGGETPIHEVVVSYDAAWAEYKYVKFFVKTATPGAAGFYKVSSLGDVPMSKLIKVTDSGNEYQTAVMPVNKIALGFYKSASFSNK